MFIVISLQVRCSLLYSSLKSIQQKSGLLFNFVEFNYKDWKLIFAYVLKIFLAILKTINIFDKISSM